MNSSSEVMEVLEAEKDEGWRVAIEEARLDDNMVEVRCFVELGEQEGGNEWCGFRISTARATDTAKG